MHVYQHIGVSFWLFPSPGCIFVYASDRLYRLLWYHKTNSVNKWYLRHSVTHCCQIDWNDCSVFLENKFWISCLGGWRAAPVALPALPETNGASVCRGKNFSLMQAHWSSGSWFGSSCLWVEIVLLLLRSLRSWSSWFEWWTSTTMKEVGQPVCNLVWEKQSWNYWLTLEIGWCLSSRVATRKLTSAGTFPLYDCSYMLKNLHLTSPLCTPSFPSWLVLFCIFYLSRVHLWEVDLLWSSAVVTLMNPQDIFN